MDLTELTQLITIRQYVANSVGNMQLDRPTANLMNGYLILVDKKILSLLQGSYFKEYINFDNMKQAVSEVAKITNSVNLYHQKK
jgi:hypothetical protein